MPTECNPGLFDFGSVEGRRVVAGFDGGRVTSDAGALLLGATDRAIGLIDRFAGCFSDGRSAKDVEHAVATLVCQRVFGIASVTRTLSTMTSFAMIRCWQRSLASL